MSRSIAQQLFAAVALAGLLLASIGAAQATTLTWPGAAPCNTTLQACIDGTGNGDRIEIATTTIAEDISLYDRDRTLAPAVGYHPAFGPGHWLSITSSSISGDRTVAVSGLSFTDGYVYVNYRGTGTSNIDLRGLTLTYAGLPTSNYIRVEVQSGTMNAIVYDNRITGVPTAAFGGMITLAAHGGTLNGDAYFNHVKCVAADLTPGAGILADYAGIGSAGTARIFGNEVRGAFGFGSIVASEGLGSADPVSFNARAYSNVVVGNGSADAIGLRYLVNAGTLSAQAVENTVTRVTWGLYAGPYSGAPAASRITGLMSSNLVRANVGLYIDGAHAPAMTNDYNLINSGSNLATLGVHSITTDAKLVSDDIPRLRSDSPGIDASDNATVGLGIIFNGLPVLDADGLRRLKGAGGIGDIGAYEFGDVTFSHTATASNVVSGSYITAFDNASVNGIAAAMPIATSNYSNGDPSGVLYSPPFGVYYFGGLWRLFAENSVAMPLGAHFDVFAPAVGAGAFVHVADAGNSSGSVSRIDNTSTDSLPDRIVLVTQNWSAGGASVYNPHQVGLTYFGHWFAVNLDGTDLPLPLGFDIYAQEASPNAFRAVTPTAGGALVLYHPLLDNKPCARPHVSRISGAVSTDYGFDLDYSAGHWRIFGHAALAAGDAFNVVVDAAQVDACTDVIFANSFD
ncbi:MAG: hypothetical protein ABIW82_01435 [Dokdonella sp.]